MDRDRDPDALEVRTTEDGSRTLFDPAAGQTYHSGRGAWTETRHVFVEGSGVAERLRRGGTVHVAEVGLGTGTNLLATWDAARRKGARIHYRALELAPPTPDAVRALGLERVLADPALLPTWLDVLGELRGRGVEAAEVVDGGDREPTRSCVPPTLHAFDLADDLRLEVALGDAAGGPGGAPGGAAAELLSPGWAHAIYHDAFSRDATPSLWSPVFLTACADALVPGGAWVSYSVAGVVRRTLAAAGLEVRKLPGPPGGKPQMLRADRPATDGAAGGDRRVDRTGER